MSWPSIHRVYATVICVLCIPSLLSFAQVAQPVIASGQPISTSTFFAKAQETISGGKPLSTLNISATTKWIAGSDREDGTAQLQAKADGSTSIQLDLGKASRTETQTALSESRTCQWTDAANKSHGLVGANCFVAIPWFAPTLFAQEPSRLSSLTVATDDGEIADGSSTEHQISYQLSLVGVNSDSTTRRVKASTVKVRYSPQTFLPTSLEYKIHPDGDDLRSLDVKVTFSNYQSVSGVMLPFHIEKYVNRTLQLSLDVTNATIE